MNFVAEFPGTNSSHKIANMQDSQEYFVISDVHLGSKYCNVADFKAFLRNLKPGVCLVLNGDTIDEIHTELPAEHEDALSLLRDESYKRTIIWVTGNHDEGYRMRDQGKIDMRDNYSIGKRLFIAHGFDFDNVMPYNRWFIVTFRFFHRVRIKLGAESVHVAYYAKRFPWLYKVLCRFVTRNAVEYARENGYQAITCGHTHYMEDLDLNGIRYINTGAWTEKPIYCLQVTDSEMKLVKIA